MFLRVFEILAPVTSEHQLVKLPLLCHYERIYFQFVRTVINVVLSPHYEKFEPEGWTCVKIKYKSATLKQI